MARRKTSRESGFTLIEIMAVVIIMGLLMGLVGVTVFDQVQKARVMTAKAQIAQIESALEFYRMNSSRYPSTDEGLEALLTEPSSGARNYPKGGYLRKKNALLDAWDEPFHYQNPGQRNSGGFDVWSLGADAKTGGEDVNADIGNWDANQDQE